jgi:DNA-binding transcriptional ArsR family regulator
MAETTASSAAPIDAPIDAPKDASADETVGATCTQLPQAAQDFLKALANPGRQQLMLLFAQGAELSVNQVAERAGISQSAASQQLALLRRGGIVTSRRDGKEVLYRGDRDSVAHILGDLQDYLKFCC